MLCVLLGLILGQWCCRDPSSWELVCAAFGAAPLPGEGGHAGAAGAAYIGWVAHLPVHKLVYPVGLVDCH